MDVSSEEDEESTISSANEVVQEVIDESAVDREDIAYQMLCDNLVRNGAWRFLECRMSGQRVLVKKSYTIRNAGE